MTNQFEAEALKALTDVHRVFREMGVTTTIESSDFERDDISARKEERIASIEFVFPRTVPEGSNLSVRVSHRSGHMDVSLRGEIFGKPVSNRSEDELEQDTLRTAKLIQRVSDLALLQYYHAVESSVLGSAIRS
jgi:hypothetical protein